MGGGYALRTPSMCEFAAGVVGGGAPAKGVWRDKDRDVVGHDTKEWRSSTGGEWIALRRDFAKRFD